MAARKTDAPAAGQAARSAAMRARLITAAKQSLMDSGYGRTTAVEVCARAGVTRGALFHHFSGLPALLAATLEEVCAAMGARTHAAAERNSAGPARSAYIDSAWSIFGHPEFKIVIEVWLAARNDETLRGALEPVIAAIRDATTPELNARLAAKVGKGADDVAFYRLVLEAMIGMALGRAVSPDSRPLPHAEKVVAVLKQIAGRAA